MKFKPNMDLFWFFKKGARLDLADPADLDTYIKQAITHGKTKDIRELLRNTNPLKISESFGRIKDFLPREVKMFWEDFIASPNFTAKRAS